jgi:nicotinamide phosphoribosyltransferase
MNNMNPFLCTDGYKTSHHQMYPEGTTLVYSNFTPRHGKHTNVKGGKGVVSFGQQMIMRQIKEMFDKYFFNLPFMEGLRGSSRPEIKNVLKNQRNKVCQEIKQEYSMYLGYDYDVSHIERLWDLGYLPIKVKALPEGTFVPYGVPVLTIVNTNPDFFWLTNFLETLISNMLWMPMTAATTAHHYKEILTDACLQTDAQAIDFVDFQGHNFGMRGMAGIDATVYAGLGHATSFKGDDSLPTIASARKYYDEKGFVVGSVNATEHSVMCAGGDDSELETFRYLMKQFPTGILSIVSDTWNLWDVLTKYLPVLKDEIMSRDGKIVIRPDSGDPVDIICGLNSHPNPCMDVEGLRSNEESKGVIELLWDLFGGTINDQGYKVLDPHIGAIYGDSITPQRAKDIVERLKLKGFASTNVVLGIGSFTYQFVTRDTHGFAMKATYVEIMQNIDGGDNEGSFIPIGREIFKDPITSDGSKKSAKGLLQVGNKLNPETLDSIGYSLKDQCNWDEEGYGNLQTIFNDGDFYNQTTLTEIRERVSQINNN